MVLFLFGGNAALKAQKPEVACDDPELKAQADGVKTGFNKQGMVLFEEAMLKMKSLMPAPIVVRMQKGQLYQLIFIGNQDANRLTFELFDGADKRIHEKTLKGGGNQIVYSFTPPKTDAYLITLTQKKGNKEMCGYFGVMASEPSSVIDRTPQPSGASPEPPKQVISSPPVSPVAKPQAAPIYKTQQAPQKTVNRQTTIPQQSQKVDYNQQPNRNRTKATREYQKTQGK